MGVFWSIFELMINLAKGFIVSQFLCKYLGFKPAIKHKNAMILIFACINFVIISIFDYFTIFEGFWGILTYIIIAIIFSIILLDGKLYQQIIISWIVYVLFTSVNALFIFLYSNIFQILTEEIMIQKPSIYRLIIVCSVIIIFFCVTRIILKMKNKDYYLKSINWKILIIMPVIALIIVFSIENGLV